ncbi:hypothetical protein BHU72_07190 [Desulfuribacillus stibiiarsenatis]|uniref:Putative Se/S carrier protein-like domain-containing protein n=1 Tax=Desulfuribacillus stibiiarsenatis TaxID=1390249 RepID=A0A1E5L4B0_9FIRM|nr:DUF3343 domain-containing protein [Desulfuribacillus stibiiarsenatis]OEH84968.1 hypothetical protein BHU72_07190 [Desulfuribacillus stibiiarsenatis]
MKLVIFPTVHWTLTAEKALKSAAINHHVVPVPPYVNEGCGLGIKISDDLENAAMDVFYKENIEIEKVITQ